MSEAGKLIEKHSEKLALSLDEALKSVLVEYEKLQASEQKEGMPAYIYISFLHSAVLCEEPWLRIDIYDKNDRFDLTECSVMWDIPDISNKLYLGANETAREDGIKEEYKIEQLWLELSEEYFGAIEKHISDIISNTNTSSKVDCLWHYGSFLGSTAIVWGGNQDGVF